MFEMMAITIERPFPQIASVYQSDGNWGARRVIRTQSAIAEPDERIEPDTDLSLSVSQMGRALELIAKPTEVENVPLTIDLDDYPFV